MKNFLKKCIPVFLIGLTVVSFSMAEQVKKLSFEGITNTEKVTVEINDKNQIIEYQTPSRNSKYQILDYDYIDNLNSGERTLKCTALDILYSTAYEIMLYTNKSFSDIRIGKKRVTFKYVSQYDVETKAQK